jgi:hypothetical protein
MQLGVKEGARRSEKESRKYKENSPCTMQGELQMKKILFRDG